MGAHNKTKYNVSISVHPLLTPFFKSCFDKEHTYCYLLVYICLFFDREFCKSNCSIHVSILSPQTHTSVQHWNKSLARVGMLLI